ncbi:MAG TPA: cytochrome c [Methylomirabilota bacterium]|nr:cytochrome c [Methylomirabilota bacterium]
MWCLRVFTFTLGVLCVLPDISRAQRIQSDRITRGRYIFALAGGCGCHTPKDGPVNAGGRPLKTPYGTFYGTNITPDPVHGVGNWTDQQIIDAIRLGIRPDGSVMSPVMPYPAFNEMSDQDVSDLVAYLRTLPPVARANQPHELCVPFPGLAMRVWRWLFFTPRNASQTPAAGLERGRYISEHLAHCQECHTPRTIFGTLDRSRDLAGNAEGIDGEISPNITPEPKTGIGEWTEEEIVALLQTGFKPNFDNVQGLMALVIDGVSEGGYKDMTQEDAMAIAHYLKSVPPIVHRVKKEKEENH